MLYNILNCGQNTQNQIKIHNKIYFDFAWVNSRRAAISFHLCLICVPLRCICGAPKRKYKIKCLQKTGTHAMLNLFLGRQSVEVGSSCCCENFLLCTWKYFIIKYLISSNMCGTAFALCTSNMCGRAIVCIRRPPSKSNIGCVRRRRIKGKTVTILIVQVRNMKKASKSVSYTQQTVFDVLTIGLTHWRIFILSLGTYYFYVISMLYNFIYVENLLENLQMRWAFIHA